MSYRRLTSLVTSFICIIAVSNHPGSLSAANRVVTHEDLRLSDGRIACSVVLTSMG